MFNLTRDEQLKRLAKFENTFRVKELSLAEGRRLAADLYANGGLFPELLQRFDEFLLREIEKRKND